MATRFIKLTRTTALVVASFLIIAAAGLPDANAATVFGAGYATKRVPLATYFGRDIAIIERRNRIKKTDHPKPPLEPSAPSGLTSIQDEPDPLLENRLNSTNCFDGGHGGQVPPLLCL